MYLKSDDYGFNQDRGTAACINLKAYERGYVDHSYEAAKIYLAIGDTLDALRAFGVNYGYETVRERLERRFFDREPLDDLEISTSDYAVSAALQILGGGGPDYIPPQEHWIAWRSGVRDGAAATQELQQLYAR